MRSIVIAGSGPNASTSVATIAAPVGVVSSPATRRRGQRNAPQQLGRGRRGNAAAAVGDLDEAGAGGHRRAHDRFDAQQVPADRRADDVGDRIDRADFVEVDLLDRRAVDLGLGLGQPAKDPLGQVFLRGR